MNTDFYSDKHINKYMKTCFLVILFKTHTFLKLLGNSSKILAYSFQTNNEKYN